MIFTARPYSAPYVIYRTAQQTGPVANGAGGAGWRAVYPSVRVDALVREGNRVTGVQAGDDILDANIVILADGVNSMLGRSLDMVPVSSAHHYAVGVKELIGLSPALIEERFNLASHEGAAVIRWRALQRAHGRRVSLYQPRFGFSGAGMWLGRHCSRDQKRTANAGRF